MSLPLTQELGQPRWLIVVFHGDADRVEKDQHNHEPIEPLLLDRVANFEPEPLTK